MREPNRKKPSFALADACFLSRFRTTIWKLLRKDLSCRGTITYSVCEFMKPSPLFGDGFLGLTVKKGMDKVIIIYDFKFLSIDIREPVVSWLSVTHHKWTPIS